MTRLMYDSVTAADIPADAPMVAGYIDGQYAWSAADWARFPTATKVTIATQPGSDAGDVLDVELGDATVSQAPGWVRMRQAAGLARPTVYVARWEMGALEAALSGLDHALWVADWTGQPHPIPGAAAVQFADPSSSGGHYDLSLVTDDTWPYGTMPVRPPAEDEMTLEMARLQVWPWYPNWCGRVGSQEEVDGWATQLTAAGANYEAVVTAFYSSPECVAYRTRRGT